MAVGHWLDLLVHVLAWRGLPTRLQIVLACADPAGPDDNGTITITITSVLGDLLSVMLTSRCAPLKGANESIQIQHPQTTCKIDDFRHMTLWQGAPLMRRRY